MAVNNLNMVRPGSTIYLPFNTFDSNDPSASVTITGFALADIGIYKDGGTTERASTAGVVLLDTDGVDFDSTTGVHGISIDLSDNTTANFYEAGSRYFVTVGPITVDAATVNFVLGTFEIGYSDAILNTVIATLASQTSFTLEEGPADDDALNGFRVLVHDLASSVQIAAGVVSDYTGSTRTVTLKADPGIFTMAAGDNASFFMPALTATTPGNTLDVETGGTAGIDWGNIANPTTAVDLSGTDIQLCDTVTTNTDMRGTDSAALASVVGALTDAAAAGDPTTADTLMQYVKQLINILVGTTGITTFPAEAAPANNVSLAEVIRAIHADVTGLNGDAMRGTDGANTTTPPTAAAIVNEWETQSQADPTGFHVNVLEVGGTAQTANDNGADINAILVDTNSLNDTKIPDTISLANINGEVVDVLKTDTVTLPGQVAPPLAPTMEEILGHLYKAYRNRKTQTATQWSLMADDESTVDQKSTVSDDGTTAIKQEIVSGP